MTLYLDTSSLVKLYVPEAGSSEVRALFADADIAATSTIAYPETRAALARLRREDILPRGQFTTIKRSFEAEWPEYLVLDVTSGVSREAGELAEQYGLRGFDAVHLASFAAIARAAGVGSTQFSSFDERLNRAARDLSRRLQRAN